ncbi:MAG: TonB-dependent receptor domain-containing protein [Myxococcaceae bacterium]
MIAALATGPARADAGPPPLTPSDAVSADAGPPRNPAHLTGVVQTRGTREPIGLAGLEVVDGGPAVEADPSGHFELTLPPGPVEFRVRGAGHEARTFTESLGAGERLEVIYRLDRTARASLETVVRGRREKGEAPRVELSRAEVHEVAGTMGDPFRVAMLLPGVASIASGVAYPVVRGTQPAATGYFLDGVRIPQLYHLVAGPAVVHPDFIDRVDYYSGAVPSSYGRLLGGVIDGRLARAPERMHATLSMDLINAGGFVSLPLPSLGLEVSLAGRLSYTGLVGSAVADAVLPPSTPQAPRGTPVVNFYDYQGRLERAVGPGRLRLLLLGSSDEAGQRQSSPESSTALLTSGFHRGDLAYRFKWGGASGELGLTVGTERMGLLGERGGVLFGQFLLERQGLAARASITGPLTGSFTVRAGADFDGQDTALQIDRNPGLLPGEAASFRAPRSVGALFGAYAELDWTRGPLTATLGLRGDGYRLEPDITLWSADPRLSARFALTPELVLRAAAGLSHQPPTVLVSLPVSDLAGLRDGLQEGARFELGADAQLPFGFEATSSLFFNPLFRAVEYSLEDLLANRARMGGAGGARGRAYGFELMLRRKQEGRWFGWVSYSLIRSERLRRVYDYDLSGEVKGDALRWVPFDFDQTHVLNLTGGVSLPRGFRIGAGLHFNSGRPESGVISSRAMRPGSEPGTYLPSWVPVPLSQETRLPPFARVDLRVSKTWTLDDLLLELYLDVLNASFTSEVLGYSYEYDEAPAGGRTLRQQPFAIPVLLPYLGVKGVY